MSVDFRFSLAALDMNGTTIKDSGIFQTALEQAYLDIGRPLPANEVVEPYRGMSKSEMFAQLIPDPEQAAAAHDSFTSTFLAAVADGAVVPMEGAESALERLRALGLRICLLTGFSSELQGAIVDRLGWAELVDFAVSSDEVEHGRPAPDLILRAAERAGVAAEQVVVVGDTLNDILAAERAGAGLVVGVLSGSQDIGTLSTARDARLIEHIGQLPDLVVEVIRPIPDFKHPEGRPTAKKLLPKGSP